MKIFKISEEKNTKIEDFDKMTEWFEKRTAKHIELVQKYCQKVYDYAPVRFKDIINKAREHDKSKFDEPERTPYIYLTWRYKCKADGKEFNCSKEMEDDILEATETHISTNRHHPEYYTDRETGLVNKDDRDKPPKQIIDATKMPDVDLAEMCADWRAVGEERGTKTKDWADKNVNIRWKFTDEQKDLIYELIKVLK